MFSPLDLIVENLRGLAIRVETLEARPMIAVAVAATAPVKSASSAAIASAAAVDEDKKITLSNANANTVNANATNANAVKPPSMAEFESKIQKLSGDIQAAKKLIETVMTIKIESHIARIEERILAKIDTRINLAIEKVNAAKPVAAAAIAVAPVVPVTVPVAAAAAVVVVVDVVAPIVNVTALANASTADDINITIGSHISVDDVVKSESGEFEIELKPKKDKSKKAK